MKFTLEVEADTQEQLKEKMAQALLAMTTTPASPAPMPQAPVSPPPAKPAAKTSEAQPDQNTQPTPDAPPQNTEVPVNPTIDQVRAALTGLVNRGKAQEAKGILERLDAHKVTELDPKNYVLVMQLVSEVQ